LRSKKEEKGAKKEQRLQSTVSPGGTHFGRKANMVKGGAKWGGGGNVV